MPLTVNLHVTEPVHIHVHGDPSPALVERVARLESQLTALELSVGVFMSRMSDAVARLTTEVSQARTVATSAKVLVEALAEQIRTNVNDPAQLEALADSLDSGINDLQAAVLANTPAEVVSAPSTPASTAGEV